MSNLKPNVPEYRRRSKLAYRLFQAWPFYVWLAVAALTFFSYQTGGRFRPLNGQVQVKQESPACLETAQISTIHVEPGAYVKKGELLITMDTTLVDERIQALRQEIRMEILNREKNFLAAEQNLRDKLHEIELSERKDIAAHEVLTKRSVELSKLVKQGLINDSELADIEIRLADLGARIESYPQQLASYRDDLERYKTLKGEMNALTGDDEERMSYLDRRLERLIAIKETFHIRASSDGTVAELVYQVGEIVPAGKPILILVKDVPPRIETFVPETFTNEISLGMKFSILPLNAPEKRYEAEVINITPNMVSEMDRANLMAKRMVRGRKLVLKPGKDTDLLPGESVMIEAL